MLRFLLFPSIINMKFQFQKSLRNHFLSPLLLHTKIERSTERRSSAQVPIGDERRLAQICVPLLLTGLRQFIVFKVKVTRVTSLSNNRAPPSCLLLSRTDSLLPHKHSVGIQSTERHIRRQIQFSR